MLVLLSPGETRALADEQLCQDADKVSLHPEHLGGAGQQRSGYAAPTGNWESPWLVTMNCLMFTSDVHCRATRGPSRGSDSGPRPMETPSQHGLPPPEADGGSRDQSQSPNQAAIILGWEAPSPQPLTVRKQRTR